MARKEFDLSQNPDVVLIGAGIMSATLGVLLKELQPDLKIEIYERLHEAAAESSDAWNNAGTGHSAFCELNYTPENPDGSIDTTKAVNICESFETTKQFWAYLIQKGLLQLPDHFITSVPHMSFVWGEDNVNFLQKRHQALTQCHLFKGMKYSEDPEQLTKWMPLIMKGRDLSEKFAATYMALGTDVNFGALTRCMFNHLKSMDGVKLFFGKEVSALKQKDDMLWRIKMRDLKTGDKTKVYGKFVFIGAGGGALELLDKSDIPEGKGYGGFPVSGQWLKCTNPEVIFQHRAKVYGKASVGAPPMSVPHLDTRIINGERQLLFGPYAGFSTKFLKKGSYLDLFNSIGLDNLRPMIFAGIRNIPLTKYLIDQVRQSPEDRLAALRDYYPEARMEDWELAIAGQRVQIIKKDPEHGGVLQFGTEIVSGANGSLAALLGASPGASTAVSIMLNLIEICFKDKIKTPEWQAKLKEMIPSYGQSLAENPELLLEVRNWTSKVLGLPEMEEVKEEI
ncbi:MAG: malate:quinone oxidoreductase [Hymenobacteraceae bacterium]|nr:malate:quinone oxidoreductase [Hymenobacteraceae bacterium]MDX5395215.1 malate:quinone oxidoreductase [Hymenobacteraceae bacterium]MDX5442765.1 malate:quinone oxidoreductase [Hymenobacteraceae bacterium]MDX5511253.1 malate:quinone oxidoreductase [Hymenobacteraceae bacterium]